MRKPRRSLLVLHADTAFRERVRRAAQPRFEVEWIAGWAALADAVVRSAPSGIAVVDPYHGNGTKHGPASELQGLLRDFPSATVVAAAPPHRERLRDVRTLGTWGITDIIDTAEDSAEAMRLRLEAARSRPLRALIEQVVAGEVSGRGRAILEEAVEIVATGQHARDLARALNVSEATLLRWCRRAGIPVPRRLLVWMRTLLAAELLDDPGQSVLGVALACGYSSDRTLRRAFYSAVGMGPSALRERGAFQTVSKAFVAALQETRRSSEFAPVSSGNGAG